MSRAYHLKRKYGITEEQYNELLQKQGNRCGVCQRQADEFKVKLSVDHDHWSGQIRGLLCTYCNRRVIGRHRLNSGHDLLRRGYEYLIADYPGWVVPPKKRKRRCRRKTKKPSQVG